MKYENAYYAYRHPSKAVIKNFIKYGNISSYTRVLDLGCGTSRYLAPLAALNSLTIIGLDNSVNMIKKKEFSQII
jgi:predicted TPR repeat methyltransferase